METAYLIRPMTEADLALAEHWRAQPHVARWWGDPQDEPEAEKLRDPRIALWIVEFEARPLGLIQDYRVHDWSPHHFDYLPQDARGMDVFVGEPDLVGCGHGSRFLKQHVDGLFSRGAPAAGIDPHPDNLAAWRAFEKAGFSLAGGPLDTRWGRAMLMHRYATDAR